MTELLAISLVVIAAIAALSPVVVIWVLLSKGLKTFLEHQKEYGISGGNRVDIIKAEGELRKLMLANDSAKVALEQERIKATTEATKAVQRIR